MMNMYYDLNIRKNIGAKLTTQRAFKLAPMGVVPETEVLEESQSDLIDSVFGGGGGNERGIALVLYVMQ